MREGLIKRVKFWVSRGCTVEEIAKFTKLSESVVRSILSKYNS